MGSNSALNTDIFFWHKLFEKCTFLDHAAQNGSHFTPLSKAWGQESTQEWE